METLLLFAMVLGFLFVGAPVGLSLGLSSILYVAIFTNESLSSVAISLFGVGTHYTLLAIPFFILASSFMSTGGVYPHWHKHPAKEFLEVDVANKLHERMSRSQLQQSRAAYMAFPPEVFAKCVNREIDKQRAAKFWAHKRNKQGMKKYLRDVEERANNA